MIKFYYHPTPNPAKVALFLEEAGLDYELIPVDTRRGDAPVRRPRGLGRPAAALARRPRFSGCAATTTAAGTTVAFATDSASGADS